MDSLLAQQRQFGISGDIVEMGVYHGKSAVIMAGRLSDAETLHLYDIADYFDRDTLQESNRKLRFNIGSTMDLKRKDFPRRAIRFCHIDASHMFDPTMHEMALADYMLSDDGILCLDDYTNLNYSQILAATFKYLFTKRTDLKLFLVTNEKAYLCRSPWFRRYASFVVDSMIPAMADREIKEICLARTDDTPSYGAFYLRPKGPGETDDFYGRDLYRGYFEIRDHGMKELVSTGIKSVARRLRRKH
jgi:hypothetical protein